jgi:hypothetical protein
MAATPKDREKYDRYLEACIFDSLKRGEAPFASHGFYTRWLKDSEPAEREAGMACGRAWAENADVIVFYVDYGMSPGMLEMLEQMLSALRTTNTAPKLEIRRLPGWFNEEERD